MKQRKTVILNLWFFYCLFTHAKVQYSWSWLDDNRFLIGWLVEEMKNTKNRYYSLMKTENSFKMFEYSRVEV